MPIVLFAVLWLAFGGASAQAQEVQGARYDIAASLDVQAHTLSAVQTASYPNDGQVALNSLYFQLAPNAERERNPYLSPLLTDSSYERGFDPSWLDVVAVREESGQTLSWSYETGPQVFQTYSLEQNLLRVELPQPLAPGQSAVIVIEFATKFPRTLGPDQSVHQDLYVWRFAWNPVAIPASELIDGQYLSAQRPYYRQIYPTALYELTLTVPKDYTVASGMDLQEPLAQDEGAGTQTLHLKSEVPVRSVALAIGKTLRSYTLDHPQFPISVYFLPGQEAAARQLATYALETLQAYSVRWGQYGYKRLTIVSSWMSGWFGMAADGFIVLGNSAFAEKDLTAAGMADRLLEYLLAHEIAHQWWGIGIGTDFNAENFLSEAFAEYLSITHFEDKHGAQGSNLIQLEREGLVEGLVQSQFGFFNLRQHFSELPYLSLLRNRFDEALVKPQRDVEFFNDSSTRIYKKGYMVLRALAGLIGSETMDQLLLQAHQKFNHRLLDSATFQALAEEASGRDLDRFFQDWVYGDASLDYFIQEVHTEQTADDQFKTEVTLGHQGRGLLPTEVVVWAHGGEKVRQVWNPESDPAVLTFVTGRPPREVQVDPDSWTPDAKRLNNYYPTRLRIIPDGAVDVPLDAYLIRLNPLNRTVEGGFVLDYRWLLGDGLLAFAVNQGRGNTLDGTLLLGEQILAELGWNLTGYEHPELGYLGTYWEPAHRLRLSLSRRLDGEAPVNFAGLRYAFSRALTGRYLYQVNAIGDPFSFGQVSVAALTQTLLWPHVTLELQAQVGYSLGALPQFLNFTLSEMNGFFEQAGDQRQKLTFPGRSKAYLRAGVSFPLQRETAYSLGGLALVRQTAGQLYLAAGQTWDRFETLDLSQAKLEAGFELTVSGQMFGGLLPFQITGGVAVALQGAPDPEKKTLEPYLLLSVPLL